DVVAAEYSNQAIESFAAGFRWNSVCERAVLAAGKTHKAAGVFSDFVFRCGAFSLRRAEFHACQKAAQILVALPGCGEQRIANACCRSDFRSNMRLNAGFLCGKMEPRCAINAVAIEESDCRHGVLRAGADQFFRQRSAFEEAESGARMKFDVG